MNVENEFNSILKAQSKLDVEAVLIKLEKKIEWVPLGGQEGNYGIIQMGSDPFDGITERITNSIDAMIERDVELSPTLKSCGTPREAIEKIYSFKDGSLRWCDRNTIGETSSSIKLSFLESGERKKPTIEIIDSGIGQHPKDFPNTLVGINRNYKVSKFYLIGAFGQGGQTSFAHCTYGIIISRKHRKLLKPGQEDLVGWTIVRYHDPSTKACTFKTGRWEYCVEAGSKQILTFPPVKMNKALEQGTIVRLVEYEMKGGTGDVLLPNSTAWSFLSQSLFDPILPIRLYEGRPRFTKRNQSLSGLARRLWQGGKRENARIWKSDSYRLDLGSKGFVKINYWALEPIDELKRWSEIRKNLVSINNALFITLNGQRHYAESTRFLRNRVDLIYSHNYLIVQVDCDGLTTGAKKGLFSTTRDRLKESEFKDEFFEEISQELRQDRNIRAFEQERKVKITSAKSEKDTTKIRAMVGKYIASNLELSNLIRSKGKKKLKGKKNVSKSTEDEDEIREDELVIPDLKDIPTFLRITNKKDPIPIEKGGKALIRLETDAVDTYFDEEWDQHFRYLFKSNNFQKRSSSMLRNGKISFYIYCPSTVRVGTKDVLTFELDLPNGSCLSISRTIICIPMKKREKKDTKKSLPSPNIITISQNTHEKIWAAFGWDEKSVGRVIIDTTNGSGIYISLDNEHLKNATSRKHNKPEEIENIESKYIAGVAFYLLLKKIEEMNAKTSEEIDDDQNDRSLELQRLAQTVAVLSKPS